MGKQIVGELVPGHEVVQVFCATGGQLTHLSVIFGTFGRQDPGELVLSLHRLVQGYVPPPDEPVLAGSTLRQAVKARLRRRLGLPFDQVPLGETLATMTIPCPRLIDGDYLDFPVGTLMTMRGEYLALCIRGKATSPGAAPTLWVAQDEQRISNHVACYIAGRPQGENGIIGKITYGGIIAETSLPEMILYSPVTQCNLNCIHCISAHTRKSVNHLASDVKSQMRDWAANGELKVISSDYSGDILWADARFGGELDFLFSLGIPFHIDTNGACLTPEVSERLCSNNIASLNISLDAATEQTYKRVRKGSRPLHEIVANIESFVQCRNDMRIDCPVSISFTLMHSTLSEWPDFIRLGARLGVDLVISRHLEAYTTQMEPDSLWHYQQDFNVARLEILALAKSLHVETTVPEPFSGSQIRTRRLCDVPWTSAVILGNGDVAACCVPGLVMGNLNEMPLQEIWNGESYRKLRATVNSEDALPACAACPMFRHTDNPDSYLIHSAMQRLDS